MRLLVTGAGGQLGHDVVLHATGRGDDVVAADRSVIDVSARDSVLGAITLTCAGGGRSEIVVG